MKTTYKPHLWNAICDVCGFEFKSNELKKDWRGLMVCKKDFELRHPQDFIKVRPEKVSVEWTRPEPTDEYVNEAMCTLEGSQSTCDVGVAGCSICNYSTPYI